MADHTEGPDELLHRLRAVGERPIDESVAAAVMSRAGRQRTTWWRTTRTKVAAAAAGGLLLGSVGLASAGTLPAPAQSAAHRALATVGVNVPPGHDVYNDPNVCPGGPYKNHGDYVRRHPGDPAAAASPCGKPKASLNHPAGTPDDQEAPDTGDANGANGQGNGKGKARGNSNGKGNGKSAKPGGDDQDKAPAGATPSTPTTTTPAPSTTGVPPLGANPPTPSTTTTTRPTTSTTVAPAPTTTTTPSTATTAP